MLLLTALRRIGRGTISALNEGAFFVGLMLWDLSLVVVNLVTFKRKIGHVVPEGHPGAGGVWPEYIPPGEGDSRCSCPALNAMANHGILPRNGRNITFKEMTRTIRTTYNFSPTFCLFVPRTIAGILGRSYSKDTLDLADIDVHNGIEHDASLTREDSFHSKSQALPSPALVSALLRSATGPPPKVSSAGKSDLPTTAERVPSDTFPTSSPYSDVVTRVAADAPDLTRTLTPADLSRRLGERRREAKENNPQYSQSFNHKMFGSSNSSTMLTLFGGRIADLHVFLTEERLPAGWEPRVRDRMGLTIGAFNRTVMRVELGIEEEVKGPILP
ncbi:Cloroperoxidase [Auriscalpium vulgare]|uniref:Cloroperoxidase n=1 Tax=Auriscalpium vulgare TaxID=40419 RepID=A0ACB8S6R4_9AGAM|nr:Cloroperoxidase [Auriscalpium vulgare]